MTAVLGGLGAGVCWTITSLFAQRAGRAIGEINTFAWGSIFSLLIALIPATIALSGTSPSSEVIVDLLAAGTCNVIGLLAQFSALRRSQLSVVVPISSAEGAVAGMVAVAAGARLPAAGWAAFGVLLAGVGLNAASQWSHEAGEHSGLASVGLAVIAAMSFGCGLFFQARAGVQTPLGLAIAPPCVMGVLLVSVPLASAGKIVSARPARLWLVGLAAAEILGFISYVIGARQSVPVAAVLSAQYATITVLIGVLALRERVSRQQAAGIALTTAGVVAISLLGQR